MTQVFKARWVLPVDAPPIEHGEIVVEHGRIVAVGRTDGSSHADSIDYGDAIITPGFVNPHTHLELTAYQGAVPRGPLWDWFAQLIDLRRRPGAEEIEKAGVYKGAALSLRAGVTCVGDICRTAIHVEELAASPLRKVCYVELISGAVKPPNNSASLRAIVESLLPRARESRLIIGISPHTPYTVLPQELKECAGLAAEHNLPLTMHAVETTEESAWLRGEGAWLEQYLEESDLPTARERWKDGLVELMRQANLLDRPILLAHMNYADERDIRELASTTASVVWCPRAHGFFGHTKHPWRQLLAQGLNVCVGTDSLASNESLSILDELRFLHASHSDCAPETLLEMGTIRGAAALGLGDRIGSLSPGKFADFAVFPIDAQASHEPVHNLLEGAAEPMEVRIDGANVWRDA